MDHEALARSIKGWGMELGFRAVGIADASIGEAEPRLMEWLARGWHGEMEYMARHGTLRARPEALHAGTLRVISCRMDYAASVDGELPVNGEEGAYIAKYARGRDYHKVLRA